MAGKRPGAIRVGLNPFACQKKSTLPRGQWAATSEKSALVARKRLIFIPAAEIGVDSFAQRPRAQITPDIQAYLDFVHTP
ncbi:hypothetical protein BH23PLA1_BH23PLA1_40950 [soil metagenome]